MSDITNQSDAQEFFKEQMSVFFAMYAETVQRAMKSEWDIDIEHRECWDVVHSVVMQKFGDQEFDLRKFRLLQAQMVDETIWDIRDILISKYSNQTFH